MLSYSYPLAKRLFLFFVIIFSTSSLYAQSDFSKIDHWLKENVNELGGRVVLMLYKGGKIVYSHAENDLSRRQKAIGKFIAKRRSLDASEVTQDFTPTTREMVASCSKWYSAALVMTFVDEGKLSIEDTIGKFLPVFTAHGKGGIKIWHCLSHLTGIQPGDMKESIQEMKDITSMDEAMQKLAAQPMEGLPGKTFHYSNAGLQIAAAVIEKISGKDFETLFAERIARPLDMKNTDYGRGKVPLAAGGARSTPNDYMNFLQMILQEGTFNGKQVISKKSIVEMQKDRVGKDVTVRYSPAEAGNWGYGFGEWVINDASAEKRSDGVASPGLFGSFPWVDNGRKYCGFLFTLNLKNKGRNEKYKTLKKLVDEALGG